MTKLIQSRNWAFLKPVGATGRVDTRYPTGEVPSGDEPGTVALTSTSVSITEGTQFTVSAARTGGTDGAIAVDWGVSGGLSVPATGTFTWDAGASGTRTATPVSSLVDSITQGTISLASPRRTDGGNPPPSLGTSLGTISVSDAPTSWTLPSTLSIQQGGNIPLRQYVVNGTGWTISVSGLPTGVTYNAGLERLEGASTGTASATVTFTLTLGAITVVDTATVALVDGLSVSWVAPTQTVSDAALSGITGYKVYWGTESMVYTNSLTVNDPSATSASIPGLSPGTYYIAVTTLANGYESTYSHEVVKVVS